MTTTTVNDDGYIVQRATKIVTAFNEHLTKKCDHCQRMLMEIYKRDK